MSTKTSGRAGRRPPSLSAAAMSALGPEAAHRATIRALANGVTPRFRPVTDPALEIMVWGRRFPNPIGIAAGFDKNAEAVDGVFALGVGFTEVGGVTPRPQRGSLRPRVFRLRQDRAVVNRLGFNNDGLQIVAERLRARRRDPVARSRLVGVNIGANANSVDRVADYETVLRGLWGLCAFYTLNVSSPNTPGLRGLQEPEALTDLLTRLLTCRNALADETGVWAPLLVKVDPDLSNDGLRKLAEVASGCGVDGMVATNTTVARSGALRSRNAGRSGGLSGEPLFGRSTEALRILRRATNGAVPLIGVGGVGGPEQAYAKIRAGASLVQLYTGLIYQGPGLVTRIARGLGDMLRADGFERLEQAVGADA
ncbi:MAG: quinone-dependent dihydroorotate dehydrogenase [Pseudomonadota bacterium]